jgi:hypothetical protein
VFSKESQQCYQFNPVKYGDYLTALNDRYLDENKRIFEPFTDFLNYYKACAIVIGSDGKGERHTQSKTEIVFIQDDQTDKYLDPRHLVEEFEKITGMIFFSNFFTNSNKLPRIKKIGRDVLSWVDQNSNLVYPDRLFNSKLICGDNSIFQKIRENIAIEMGLIPGLSGKIRREIRNQRNRHFETCQSGISRMETCFDQEYQYYDEGKTIGKYGFKHGFIRLIQRNLDLRTQASLRDKIISINKISNLPVNTVERIMFFSKDQKSLCEAYLWFLQKYHQVQEEYKERKSLAVMSYDKYSFKENSEIILRDGMKISM